MDPEFWNGRSVFVTGHTGFKGGWLCLWLQRLGARVVGYSLPPPTTPSLFAAAGVADGMQSLDGDVRDAARLAAALREARPEVVFHLAAQAIVRTGYEEPVETYATNVMGTCHLLEAVRQCPGVRAVVVVTSDKCYADTGEPTAHREDDPMGGHDPYSSSKGCAELVTAAYRLSFLSAAPEDEPSGRGGDGRAGNVIGGGDWGDHRLVPDVVRAVAGGEPVRVRSPQAVRPWQHVVNPLSGYLQLAEELCGRGAEVAEAWNFGPGERGLPAGLVAHRADRPSLGRRRQLADRAPSRLSRDQLPDARLRQGPGAAGLAAAGGVGHGGRLAGRLVPAARVGGDVRALTLEQIAETELRLAIG